MTETLLDDDRATPLSTQPEAPTRPAGRGPIPALRQFWRQLTSMRTALLLLALLALAAIPGTVIPQRGLDPVKVNAFLTAHPHLGPFMDKLSLFDVFAAPWFAAIYLLLAISLIGCLVPRIRLHAKALRRRPPVAPRHLLRMPASTEWRTDETPSELPPGCTSCFAAATGGPTSGRSRMARSASRLRRATCARPATWSFTSHCSCC